MAHPPRYDDTDPLLERLRHLALAPPGATEKVSHGTPTFVTTKVFAQYGAHVKGDHHSTRLRRSLVFRPEQDERPALEQDPRVHVPAYVGAYGWLALDLTAGGEPDWTEVAELLEVSYRLTAPARLVRELDATGSAGQHLARPPA